MAGSAVDYNGNGDVDEGIYYELQGLQDSRWRLCRLTAVSCWLNGRLFT